MQCMTTPLLTGLTDIQTNHKHDRCELQMPLTSLERGCWLPVAVEGWQVWTPGSTRHHTGPSYSCAQCMAQ